MATLRVFRVGSNLSGRCLGMYYVCEHLYEKALEGETIKEHDLATYKDNDDAALCLDCGKQYKEGAVLSGNSLFKEVPLFNDVK
jgi:hypothetical protein